MKAGFYRTFQGGEEPDEIRVVTRSFINQFEVPVLFYVGLILTYVTQQVSYWMVACAWLYVALRASDKDPHSSASFSPLLESSAAERSLGLIERPDASPASETGGLLLDRLRDQLDPSCESCNELFSSVATLQRAQDSHYRSQQAWSRNFQVSRALAR